MSLTGDRRLDQLLPTLDMLVQAAHYDRPVHIEAALADAERLYGDPLEGAKALLVLACGCIPDDQSMPELLLWKRDPHEYRRQRAAGHDADTAAVRAALIAARRLRLRSAS